MPTQKRTPARRRAAAKRSKPATSAAPANPVRQLWLAGLGAAVVSTEVAVAVVDELVARGRRQAPKTRAAAAEIVDGLRDNAGSIVRRATHESKKALDRTMKQLGVQNPPRQKNILHRLGDLAEALL